MSAHHTSGPLGELFKLLYEAKKNSDKRDSIENDIVELLDKKQIAFF